MADYKFNFPIVQYLQQLVRDSRPELNTQVGSAIHDLVITPMSLIAQDVNDKINVLKQSSTLINYTVMTRSEMDKLAANFFIERRTGNRAYGVIRIYLTTKRPISITADNFASAADLRWSPITPKDYAIEDLNFDPTTTEFYIDVAYEAVEAGEDYTLSKGDDVTIEGITASRSSALYDFVIGTSEDTNADLYTRIQDSISNNELVKPTAIKKILQDTFTTIRNIAVIGYGDEGMDRDIVRVALPLEDMFGVNLCVKVQLPLDADGEVNWYDDLGNIITSPIGGWVGAIYDVNNKDFNNLAITWDGRNYTTTSVQPGFVVRFLSTGSISDPDVGDHYVARVESVPLTPGGVAQQIIRLNDSLNDTTLSSYQYKLLGTVGANSFHVGGKTDVALDDSSNEDLSVIVDYADEVDPAGSNVIEIPLTSEQVLHPSGSAMFEDNTAFVEPVLMVVKVEQVSFGASTNIEKVLVPFRDYTVVRAEHRKKYTSAPYDVLRIMALEEIGGVSLNPYIGKRIKITYVANRQFTNIQEFLDSPSNKTGDINVVYAKYVFADVRVSYRSDTLEQDTAVALISDYIKSTSFEASLSSSHITQLLLTAGATYVKQPLLISVNKLDTNGTTEIIETYDEVTLGIHEIFYPVADMLNIIKEES